MNDKTHKTLVSGASGNVYGTVETNEEKARKYRRVFNIFIDFTFIKYPNSYPSKARIKHLLEIQLNEEQSGNQMMSPNLVRQFRAFEEGMKLGLIGEQDA